MAHLTTGQIKQLLEIDHAGPGIRTEVQELIKRLTSGGVGVKTDDPRVTQAKRLWDKGFGRELGIDSFEHYLANIPVIPESLLAHDERFPELVLVDAGLGITKICELLGIDFSGDDQTFEDFDPKQARTEQVYWIRLQDGKKNCGKSVQTCRKEFAQDEIGLTFHEGLAFFAQCPESFRKFALDLTGSVTRDGCSSAAYLYWTFARPELSWYFVDDASQDSGAGSRRK